MGKLYVEFFTCPFSKKVIKLWTAAAGFVTLNVYVQESTLSIIPFPSSSLLDGIQAGLVLDHRYRTIIEDRPSQLSPT